MGLTAIFAIIAVGIAVGLASGLVGIGGGVLIVPFLYFFYDRPDLFGVFVAEDLRVVTAHATSLFIIVPTAMRGAWEYHRAELVEWRAVFPIGLASVFAAVVGSQLATILPGDLLRAFFGVLLLASGLRLAWTQMRGGHSTQPGEPRLSWPITVFTGSSVGLFSALLGVGGGIVAIPLLVYLVRLDMRKVAATSIGIIGITASAGVLSYIFSGMGVAGRAAGSLGYVHAVAGVLMFVTSVVAVVWGARLNQHLPPNRIALIFAGLFALLGIRLIVINL